MKKQNTDFNVQMLRLLKGKKVEQGFLKYLEQNGFEVFEKDHDFNHSSKGYPTVYKNDRALCISTGYDDKVGLFNPFKRIKGYKDLGKVDFHNYFAKVKYEPFKDNSVSKSYYLKRMNELMNDRKRLSDDLERLLASHRERVSELERQIEIAKKDRQEVGNQ